MPPDSTGSTRSTGSTSTPVAPPAMPSMRAPDGSATGHVPVLDGIRGVAILLVMAIHLTSFRGVHAFDGWFSYLVGWGWVGVDLFFVLSGYLITGILLDARGRPHFFRDFYARRALRIFPLYYAAVVFSLLILPRVVSPARAALFGRIAGDEPYYWAYLQNFAMARAGGARHAVLDITWSLAIEEQFYLVWPTVVLLCSRRALERVCAALFVLALASRALGSLYLHLPAFSVYVLTPCRMDALAAGAFLAARARAPGGLAALVPAAKRIGPAAGLAALALVVVEHLTGLAETWEAGLGRCSVVVGFTLNALAFGALLLVLVEAPPSSRLRRAFSSRGLRFFGVYAYGLYLLHMPVRALVWERVYGPASRSPPIRFPRVYDTEILGQILFYPVALAAIVPVAWLSYHLYEKQFLKLKRFFGNGKAPRAPDVEPVVAAPAPRG